MGRKFTPTDENKIYFLTAYKTALKNETVIRDKIKTLRERQAAASAIQYTGMPHGTDLHDLSDYTVRLEELIIDLTERMKKTDEVYEVISAKLKTLNREEYIALYQRFIREKNPVVISSIICCARESVYRYIRRGLENLEVTDADIRRIDELLYAS